eukprot:1444745-Karenia_brevis.AAC.1
MRRRMMRTSLLWSQAHRLGMVTKNQSVVKAQVAMENIGNPNLRNKSKYRPKLKRKSGRINTS